MRGAEDVRVSALRRTCVGLKTYACDPEGVRLSAEAVEIAPEVFELACLSPKTYRPKSLDFGVRHVPACFAPFNCGAAPV